MKRALGRLAIFIIGIGFGVSLLGSGEAEAVSAQNGVFYCGGACKYSRGKVEFNNNTVQHLSWWASTASGTCDSSNDVKRWRLQHTALYNDATNVKLFGYGPTGWTTNCQVVPANQGPPWAWVVHPNKAKPSDPSAHFWWQYQQEPPPDSDGHYWTSYVRLDF